MLSTEQSDDADATRGLVLRRATTADAPRLAAAAAALFRDTFGAANRPEDMDAYLAHAFSETRQRAELSAFDERVWLALDGGEEIAGYVHVRLGARPPMGSAPSERPAEIARLYADRRWHGRGLGAALMDAAVATALEWGGDLLWLGVWEKNPRAIAFYAKHGFLDVGEQEFWLGADRQRDRVMARRLTGRR
jgi:GNAT superfamily N-acetyltransferase